MLVNPSNSGVDLRYSAGMVGETSFTEQPISGRRWKNILPKMKDMLAVLLLAVGILFFFRENIQYNITFYESDTPAYYYPVMSDLVQAYRDGTLRLWSTDLFGGFPLYADGEAGSLYPIHLLLLPFFTIEQTWVWLIVFRYFLGGLFMYIFTRVLGLGQTSSLIAAAVFTFGGFSIAQLHHMNLSNSAAWLPLTLAFIELGIRSRKWARLRWLVAAGIVIAIQAVAVHVQVVLMSALFTSLYVPFRVILCSSLPFRKNCAVDEGLLLPKPIEVAAIAETGESGAKTDLGTVKESVKVLYSLRRMVMRFFLAAFILGIPGIIGIALASAQLLPEYELGTFSTRAGSVPYRYATDYALNSFDFLTLLSPFFFRDGNFYWGLWSIWEAAVYVGILPLILAITSLICVRSRYTLFLGLVVVLSLWIALGGNANPNLHYNLYQLPFFNQMRAPGRFTYLELTAVAILAAHTIEWLIRESRFRLEAGRASISRRISSAAFSTITVILVPVLIGLPVYLQSVTSWLKNNKDFALSIIKESQVNLPRATRDIMAEDIYNRILRAISLENPDVQLVLALIAGSMVLLLLWDRFAGTSWLWKSLAVLLVAADLMSFAAIFHPRITIQQLASESKAVAFLDENKGLHRVFSWPSAPMQPNRLFTFDVAEARGYSSLEFQRNKEYAAVVETVENRLLDVWNVKYIPVRKETKVDPLPSYNDTQFQTRRLLMSSSSKNAGAKINYSIPDKRTSDVRLVGWLRDSVDIPQGAVVGQIILTDVTGAKTSLSLKAGVDISEGAIDRPDIVPIIKHSRATIAFSMPEQRLKDVPYQERLYWTKLTVPGNKPLVVRNVEIQYTYPTGRLQVFGLSLYDGVAKQPFSLNSFMKGKYRVAYEDDSSIIYENMGVLPRAFLVPNAVPVESNFGILIQMTDGDWDPTKKVLIEAPENTPVLAPQGIPGTGIGTATITEYKDMKVRIKANAEIDSYLFLADSFYPGWHAYVDGQEETVYRANYLFRAIFVPKGDHEIVFEYQPTPFTLGSAISLSTLLIIIASLIFWLMKRYLQPHLSRRPAQVKQPSAPSLTPGEAPAQSRHLG